MFLRRPSLYQAIPVVYGKPLEYLFLALVSDGQADLWDNFVNGAHCILEITLEGQFWGYVSSSGYIGEDMGANVNICPDFTPCLAVVPHHNNLSYGAVNGTDTGLSAVKKDRKGC